MGNTYRAVSDRALALYGKDIFDADLSATDEADSLAGGDLVIVPRAYRVLSNNYEAGGQGDVVELALRVEQEAALISGGHIERVEKPVKRAEKPTTEKKG